MGEAKRRGSFGERRARAVLAAENRAARKRLARLAAALAALYALSFL